MPHTNKPRNTALEAALSVVGGEPALRQKLIARGWDIKSRNVIGQWLRNGVPAKYCPDIELITGVTCERLCPDVKWGLVRNRRIASDRRRKAK